MTYRQAVKRGKVLARKHKRQEFYICEDHTYGVGRYVLLDSEEYWRNCEGSVHYWECCRAMVVFYPGGDRCPLTGSVYQDELSVEEFEINP